MAPDEAAKEMGYVLNVTEVRDTDKFLRHRQRLTW